ncbi:MAG: NAD(P)H-hydrate dehydratase, partial [Nitrososphaerota archaeon]
VKANLTVTFHKPKRGVLRASAYTGEIVVASIGIPPEAENHIGPGDVLLVSRERPRDARKGDFGRLLVIGGSKQFHGAPTLAAMAAMRTGVDLVYVAVPEAVAHDVAAASPALIVVKLHGSILTRNSLDDLNPFLSRCSAVVLGPGLGILPETKEAVLKVVEMVEDKGIPLLLDADGLKAFAEFKQPTKCPLVLTPHRGEYELLSNERLPETLVEQVRHIESTARKLKAVLLVKGPIDFVSDGVRTKLNRYVHNPAMTVGGTGDVLSGIVGGLLSQGFDPFRSAAAGTFINGAAGDFAYKERGNHLLPDDLVDWIPKVMNSPMSHISVRHL